MRLKFFDKTDKQNIVIQFRRFAPLETKLAKPSDLEIKNTFRDPKIFGNLVVKKTNGVESGIARALPIAIGLGAALASIILGLAAYHYKNRKQGAPLRSGLLNDSVPPVDSMI